MDSQELLMCMAATAGQAEAAAAQTDLAALAALQVREIMAAQALDLAILTMQAAAAVVLAVSVEMQVMQTGELAV